MNIQTFDPRQIAWQIIRDALTAVDPAVAVTDYFDTHPEVVTRIQATSGRVFVVGAGKAGAPMTETVLRVFDDKIVDGRVIVKYGHTSDKSEISSASWGQVQIREAGHPIPDEAGLTAAREIGDLLRQTNPEDTVLCLISGGGSALLTLPANGLTLGDLQATTESLLAAGVTINQFNTIRKHLSAVKGGGIGPFDRSGQNLHPYSIGCCRRSPRSNWLWPNRTRPNNICRCLGNC